MSKSRDPRHQEAMASFTRFGTALALGVLGHWWGMGPGMANPLKPLRTPGPSSLAPIDQQAFTQKYGEEALFRLKLGVDAGKRAPEGKEAPMTCSSGWGGSAEEQRFEAALKRKQWYGAGEVLGTWKRQCGVGGN